MSDPTLRYVLSAGRTGTVFLARLLDGLPEVSAAHEPDTSRYQMMLANLRNDRGIGGGVLKRWFEHARKRRIATASGTYVEVNPFLCPMTDLLPEGGRRLRIVHMVRDPATWAVSIVTFKASAPFQSLAGLPFAKPYPAPRPAGWQELSEYERALWRWRWCNSRISRLRDACEAYAVVRHEDLFAADEKGRRSALDLIQATLALPTSIASHPASMTMRVNPSEGDRPAVDYDAAARICGSLARAYGYDY